MRLPQGLGGPNIAAPSALELLRARNAIPPGTEGLPGSSLPALSRSSQFEGDVAIRALRQRLALAPEMMAPPPVSHRSRSMMPSLGRFSLVLLVASTVALSVALVTLPDTRPTILKGENGPLLASVSNTQQPPARLIGVEGRQNFSNEAISLGSLSMARAAVSLRCCPVWCRERSCRSEARLATVDGGFRHAI